MKKEGVECSKCWYWHKGGENMGECRANPPMSIPTVTGSGLKRGSWLQTSGEDWCGNFKPEKSSPMVASGEILGAKRKG